MNGIMLPFYLLNGPTDSIVPYFMLREQFLIKCSDITAGSESQG